MANARPNVTDWQHKENQKQLQKLKEDGYTFSIGVGGYQIWFKDKFVTGASTGRVPHGRYHEANLRDYTQSALITAQRHQLNQSS